jgi:Arc/MetJ family transcription regulator
MRTNIEIDDTLMAEAQKASGQATKKDTVAQALRLLIRLQQQKESAPRSANIAGVASLPGAVRGAEQLGDCLHSDV